MYAEDLSDFIEWSLRNYEKLEPLTNIGQGFDHSVLDYYKEISRVVGYKGNFTFDKTKPEGMKRKLCSIEKQKKLGWSPKYTLSEGLKKTYEFYLENYEYSLASTTWDDNELEAIQSVIDRDMYTMGKSVKFEENFSKYLNCKYCVMTSSGSTANLLATAALFYTKNPKLKKRL